MNSDVSSFSQQPSMDPPSNCCLFRSSFSLLHVCEKKTIERDTCSPINISFEHFVSKYYSPLVYSGKAKGEPCIKAPVSKYCPGMWLLHANNSNAWALSFLLKMFERDFFFETLFQRELNRCWCAATNRRSEMSSFNRRGFHGNMQAREMIGRETAAERRHVRRRRTN